uniref:Putative zinc transporter n=1 Tax=Culex tarsalis TaxID=7177 RepID=A0A1Q3G562_CULTA
MNRRRVLRALLILGCLQLAFVTGSKAEHQEHSTTASGAGSAGENKFLKYLFNKYGSKGVISFEGLEHLMHSLGLGGLDFTPSHTLDEHRPEGFRTEDLLEDPHHDHPADEKVTVAFNGIDDHGRPQYSTVQGSTATPDEGTLRNRREQQVEKGHEAIINGSDWIRELNEVVSPSTEKDQDGNKTEAALQHPVDDDEDKTLKWHNEIWQEIIFKDIHDPQHRHPRRDDHRKSCLSPMSMVHLVLEEPSNFEGMLRENFNFGQELRNHLQHRRRRSLPHDHHHNQKDQDDEWDVEVEEIIAARIKITPNTFKDLCPALLAQIDQRACHQRLKDQPIVEKKFFGHAWIYAVICVTIISICGLAGVAMVPLAKSVAYDEILRFLVALAVGTLCGDALMHLLPHALITHGDHGENLHKPPGDDHGHSHSDEPVWLCCCAFLSALFMYTLETVLPLLRSVEGHDGHHHHGHSHGRAKVAPAPETAGDLHQVRRNTNVTDDIELDLQDSRKKELNTMLEKKQVEQQPLSPVAFMVILGDGLHNVTDGLAIGAAFAADPVTGMATSLAILCHELPHELGDFALLLQTGVSINRAMFLNIVSSILSFAGMFIGLLVTGLHESVVRWIYAGTAGTFLYIALADLVPEMNRDLHDPAVKGDRCKKLRVICSQIAGIFLGGMIMLVIALNEDHLRVLFE